MATSAPGLRCLVSARRAGAQGCARAPCPADWGAAASPVGHGHAPVFPDVGSMSVSPGRSTPARSASSTMRRLMRSLTLPPALKNSHLATGSERGQERRARASHTCPRRDRPGLRPCMPAPTRRGPHGTSEGLGWAAPRSPPLAIRQHSDLLSV